ncbi:hypothetical protein FKW77_001772 [Venturia effusa]|uniref:L-ornithine N(5)-oxygenase n=1 Tax=Venturia effusa TaxID=50376 RepID=A0A517LEV5_9PEZI|nr:hypothetical protein FKW77_001772 [Venturia effusa]
MAESHGVKSVAPHLSNRIHRVNGYDKENGYMYYPVVIVGAGESGIAMAHKLKVDLKCDQFRIFDRQSGLGGTWWINRYPAVAVDIPAVFYSFSFAPNPNFSSFYPPGPEIYEYLQDVCTRFGFSDKIQLNTDVSVCKWLKEEEVWEITLNHMVAGAGDLSSKDRKRKIEKEGEKSVWASTETIRAKVLVSAVGGLVEPRDAPPDVPGWDTFKGDVFHSARWNHNVDFNNKDVVVVGTGCSAAQFVPRLIKAPYNAKSVTQIMRSPPWVVNRIIPPGGNEGWSKWSALVFKTVPGLMKLMRYSVAAAGEWDWRLFGGGEWHDKQRRQMEAKLVEYIKRTVPEKYQEILTPDYGVGCKRRIIDNTWFPVLHEENVDLTTLPLTEVKEKSVKLGPGRMYPDPAITTSKVSNEEREVPADVIVLANGFDTTRWLHPLTVIGDKGQDLVDTMQERGGPQAYQGTAFDGFPNFFIIFGPNTTTGHSSVILASENMVNYASKFIKPILSGDVRTVDVKRSAEEAYTADMQKQLKKTVWMSGGCNSWYFDKQGWNGTVLPYGQIWFWYRTAFPYYNHWSFTYTRKGLIKLMIARGAKILAVLVTLMSIVKIRRNAKAEELSVKEYLENMKDVVKMGVKMGTVLGINKTMERLKDVRRSILS